MNNINFIKGNIFTSKLQTRVNTVNCVGIMGAGIALEFKYRYPLMFEKYKNHCENGLIQVGKLWIYDIPNSENKILNFPTKQHWKFPSKYEYLEKGLERFVSTYKEKGIKSIAFPLLGAQNGKLEVGKVKDLMYFYLSQVDIPVEIYEFSPYAKDDIIDNFAKIFDNSNVNQIAKLTGFKANVVKKLKSILSENKLYSLSELGNIKGVGEETVKSCFEFCMKNTAVPISIDIFKEADKQTQFKKIKEKSINELTLTDKTKLTGLNANVIFQIENNNLDISVREVLQYCKSIGVNFSDFVMKNYANIL